MVSMRRLALAFVAATLALSVSGISALVVAEPCAEFEQTATSDANCPPTCVTCGCCAQAVEPLTVLSAATPDIRITDIAAALPRFPASDPRPILHVPKSIATYRSA
jgi:hypothetical protein